MNGLEFLSLSTILWPDIPVVVVSCDQSADVADIAMRSGAFTWLHKPYERAVLLQVLRLATQPALLATSHHRNEAHSGWKPWQR